MSFRQRGEGLKVRNTKTILNRLRVQATYGPDVSHQSSKRGHNTAKIHRRQASFAHCWPQTGKAGIWRGRRERAGDDVDQLMMESQQFVKYVSSNKNLEGLSSRNSRGLRNVGPRGPRDKPGSCHSLEEVGQKCLHSVVRNLLVRAPEPASINVIDAPPSQASSPMDAVPQISEGAGNMPDATFEVGEGADRPSIVLGNVNLRERRINPTSGVVQWRIVRQGQVPRRIGGNLVQSRRLVIAGNHPKLYQTYGVGARRLVREATAARQSIDGLQRSLATLTVDGWLITRRNIMLLGNCGVGLVIEVMPFKWPPGHAEPTPNLPSCGAGRNLMNIGYYTGWADQRPYGVSTPNDID
ncbi:hypothetical protein B0H13DRAFT_1881125 [Mycena leptocephala]|nr:hypothetical protein B0H13DRAFT_1881125 [Mycena leptocephala]